MRAIELQAFGPPEVLELVERCQPDPGPDEVAIRVSHAGVNFADVMTRRGDYHGVASPPIIPGLEVAGTVAAVGSDVTDVRPGQRVVAFTGTGGYAEVAVAAAVLTFALPDHAMDLAAAAGTTLVSTTATFLVDEVARVRPGDVVLIHAAAGGVGTMLAQLSRLRGARVVLGTVGSRDKAAYARQFGYDAVVLRDGFGAAVDHQTGGLGVDVVFDSVGGRTRAESLTTLRPLGRLVVCGNASGEPESGLDTAHLRTTNRAVLGFSLGSLRRSEPAHVRLVAGRALAEVARGDVRVDITGVLDLADAAEAHRVLESGRSRGKLVLQVGGSA